MYWDSKKDVVALALCEIDMRQIYLKRIDEKGMESKFFHISCA